MFHLRALQHIEEMTLRYLNLRYSRYPAGPWPAELQFPGYRSPTLLASKENDHICIPEFCTLKKIHNITQTHHIRLRQSYRARLPACRFTSTASRTSTSKIPRVSSVLLNLWLSPRTYSQARWRSTVSTRTLPR